MVPQHPVQLLDLLRTDFRTTEASDALNSQLQKAIGFPFRYQPARLALARSLADPSAPELDPDLKGKPIKGETLFGQEEIELAFWVSLIVEHDGRSQATRRDIQDLVAAHWRRGVDRLWTEWIAAGEDAAGFLAAQIEAWLQKQPGVHGNLRNGS